MLKQVSILILLSILTHGIFSQNKLPIVKANSTKTYFTEGNSGDKNNWWLDSSVKPDIYTTNKISTSKWVAFYTDIDSLKVKLSPDDSYDFIVLLNDKDSCYTKITSAPIIKKYKRITPALHDTIPFVLTKNNNIKIEAVLNDQDTLDLYFDSGSTELVLSHEAVINKKIGRAPLSALKMGSTTWNNIQVYSVSHRGQETAGSFGWDFFDGRILEIDYDKSLMIIHSSLSNISEEFTQLDIEYTHTIFCVKGSLGVNDKKYDNRFLFDTGYQRAILLDNDLRKEQNFPKDLPIIKINSLRNGVGEVFNTEIINSNSMVLGKYSLKNIPTQLLNIANPAQFKTHILGNEFLKRYNTIFDFQNNYIYMKPNGLINSPYVDAS